MSAARGVGAGGRIVAVLGPTNTGKTHLALERMLGHRTGMIGFPLRLLARENYDRIVRLKGAANVALVTGEERIVPPAARWFVCTTEAMPLAGTNGGREMAFLAVDEIQLIADRERGHVFTDRLLHARGYAETMFLGAGTAKPVIRRLVPHAEFIERPRLSTLTHTGPKKITRLPRRSAVVAFSANDVYRIAELIRRQRGGAAVVFGALSPRTRNAQVAMYQAGEVEYIVATDAIGMGLNMDIDHVAFGELVKFDGHSPRRLAAAELGQIAGRAGRHMTDGSFGTTIEAGPLDPATVEAIEAHRFPPLTHAFWRNDALDFASPGALLASLDARPPLRELVRTRHAEDHAALAILAADAEVTQIATRRDRVALLWEACQIPDFRKSFDGGHARFVKRVFLLLAQHGRLPADWVAQQVTRLETIAGDIDSLLQRIAQIRTWTYIAHKPAWLADPLDWQGRTRAIEDQLSDALHLRLTERFVDRRSTAVTKRRAAGEELLAGVTRSGAVIVEGEAVGALAGFAFVGDRAPGEGMRAMMAAANRVLRQEIGVRVRRLVQAGDTDIAISQAGELVWDGASIARLGAGTEMLVPRIEVIASDLLEGPHREAIRRRLTAWLDRHLTAQLAPLFTLRAAELTGPARGLAYELVTGFGCVTRRHVHALLAALTRADRGTLTARGVVIGEAVVFLPALKSHHSMPLRATLWRVFTGAPVGGVVPPPLLCHPRIEGLAPGMMAALFYLPLGSSFVRADRIERLAREAFARGRNGAFAADPSWAALVGAPSDAIDEMLRALGLRATGDGAQRLYALRARDRRRHIADIRRHASDDSSPFASLAALVRR